MSKEIIDITQIDEGGQNPRTNLFEKPLWELHFINGEKRILGKVKMEEYISKAFAKTLSPFLNELFSSCTWYFFFDLTTLFNTGCWYFLSTITVIDLFSLCTALYLGILKSHNQIFFYLLAQTNNFYCFY